MGITPVANLPSVGKNLSDQPALGNAWFVNSNDTLDNITNNATLRAELLKQWKERKTGPLVASSVSHLAWLRLPANSPIFDSFADPSSGPNTPHCELVIGNGGGLTPMPGHFMDIGVIVVTPISRGTVSLRSTNPLDPPLIDLGFFTSGFDLFAMREAIQSAIRFVSAPAWKDYVIGPAGDLANATTDVLLEDYARKNAFSSAHPVGTAAMSAAGARYGVVNPDLRVKGISGLRVVDASVMPFVTSGHTQAPVSFRAIGRSIQSKHELAVMA
ncbi:putative aryl-alcohol oxidase [Lyophyllum shimeji]|uniref:Aryl-alcohol oxidase n=1 Tax=Lyophyllum shimeji TaxID=47721 RepID=A0A9P3UPL5_LYOSH|nr:putative aryl-alcohol oxidase [Lyophyllum shimeji]